MKTILHDNINRTIYRNQVNKVANAVKEVITAIELQNKKPEAILKQGIKPVSTLRKTIKSRFCQYQLLL